MSGIGRNKMIQFVNWRIRITVSDSRTLIGTLMAFDRHMNVVLADCEEHRSIKAKGKNQYREEKRRLGLVLVRGETVVSMTAIAKPPPKSRAKLAADKTNGPGLGREAGRGMARGMPPPPPPMRGGIPGMPPQGLGGPIHGLGAVAPPAAPFRGAPPPPYGAPPPHHMPPPPGGFGRGMPPMPMGRFAPPPPPPGRGMMPPPGRGMMPPPGRSMMPPPPGGMY